MVYFIYLFLIMVLGCQNAKDAQNLTNNQVKLPVGKGSTNTSSDNANKTTIPKIEQKKEYRLLRANFNGNWIDYEVKNTEATIKRYVSEFQKSITLILYFDAEEKPIRSQEKLKTVCNSMSYETKQNIDRVGGYILFFANPLHWSISRQIATSFLKEPITGINNPFIIAKKSVEVDAQFLEKETKDLIVKSGAFEFLDGLDLLRLNLFNELGGPGKKLSSAITRLLCGIADKKASLLYVFHDENGKTLKVRISGINFELKGY
jgi:hypothetical protein